MGFTIAVALILAGMALFVGAWELIAEKNEKQADEFIRWFWR